MANLAGIKWNKQVVRNVNTFKSHALVAPDND